MRAPPRRTPREFYGSTVMHVAPALEYPGEDPVLRSIHPWMAVGSGASALLCVATRAVICFATEKNIRNKTVQDPHLGFFLCPPPPRLLCEIIRAGQEAFQGALWASVSHNARSQTN